MRKLAHGLLLALPIALGGSVALADKAPPPTPEQLEFERRLRAEEFERQSDHARELGRQRDQRIEQSQQRGQTIYRDMEQRNRALQQELLRGRP